MTRQLYSRRSGLPAPRKATNVTVCIAALFNWNYAVATNGQDWRKAALAISDRMITAGDVEYEPHQTKVLTISRNVLLLIAGDYTAHSQAIKVLMERARLNPDIKAYDAAIAYGAAIQGIRRRYAEDAILAPLGLNTDSFIAQQRDMSERFVSQVKAELQDYVGPEVEGLVVGVDPNGSGHLYTIESDGKVRCYDDVGFAAIGIGAHHARLTLMQSGYTNTFGFVQALALSFIAKKAAETAPGVGKNTDIHIIPKEGAFPLHPPMVEKLEALYEEFSKRRDALAAEAITRLGEILDDERKRAAKATAQAAQIVRPASGKRSSKAKGSGDRPGADDAAKGAK